ncbi:MAG: hypothetical protein FJ286_10735 [Planctomycetes bacterium]|nr:hypothetical protein [Planctomycetota bacterium]
MPSGDLRERNPVMNVSRMTALESEAKQIAEERIEVNDDTVAEQLAREIIGEHIDSLEPADAVEAGIKAAIDEIDDGTFAFAVDVIRDRVAAEAEGQAKNIAMRMLRDTAAKAERSAAACSAE